MCVKASDAQVFWIIHSHLSLSVDLMRTVVLMCWWIRACHQVTWGETLFWGLLSELKQPARQAGTHTLTFLLRVYPDYSKIYRLKTRNEVVRTVWKSPVEPDEPLPTGPHQNQVRAKLSADSEPPLDSRIIYADSGMFGLILVLSLCRTLALTFSSHVLRGRGAIGLSDQNGSYLGLGHHQMSVGGLYTCGWAWSWSMQTHCRPCGMRWNKWPQWSWNPETEWQNRLNIWLTS